MGGAYTVILNAAVLSMGNKCIYIVLFAETLMKNQCNFTQ